MQSRFKKYLVVFAVVAIAATLSVTASAECGIGASFKSPKLHRQAWGVTSGGATLQLASSANDPITGLWHLTFTAEGNTEGPPDGTLIDNALTTT